MYFLEKTVFKWLNTIVDMILQDVKVESGSYPHIFFEDIITIVISYFFSSISTVSFQVKHNIVINRDN